MYIKQSERINQQKKRKKKRVLKLVSAVGVVIIATVALRNSIFVKGNGMNQSGDQSVIAGVEDVTDKVEGNTSGENLNENGASGTQNPNVENGESDATNKKEPISGENNIDDNQNQEENQGSEGSNQEQVDDIEDGVNNEEEKNESNEKDEIDNEEEDNETTFVNHKKDYDYSKPVPKAKKVAEDYFEDAVFIGDSRTEGFMLYSGVKNTKSLTYRGLMVDTVFTRPVIDMGGTKVTVMKALEKMKGYKKVYIMLGVNELGWAFSDIFADKYAAVIDEIKRINPDVDIYIQSILPVSEKKSSTDKIYTNKKINEYNELIKGIAKDKKVYYVDVREAVKDKNGNLPKDASFDGVHLNKEYCVKWLDYLKTHTVQAD